MKNFGKVERGNLTVPRSLSQNLNCPKPVEQDEQKPLLSQDYIVGVLFWIPGKSQTGVGQLMNPESLLHKSQSRELPIFILKEQQEGSKSYSLDDRLPGKVSLTRITLMIQ